MHDLQQQGNVLEVSDEKGAILQYHAGAAKVAQINAKRSDTTHFLRICAVLAGLFHRNCAKEAC
jgi:hypothetical protein